ncbi:MAG: MFS transporter [Eubacteriaceae bacterium]
MSNNSLRHWMVFTSACLLMVAASVNTALSFFVEPVTLDLGYTRSGFTMYVSVMTFVQIFSMPILGNIFAKFGPKKLIMIGGTICTIGLILLGYSTTLLSFYIAGAIIGLMLPAATILGAVFLINNWFKTKKGLFMGIAMSASGIGGALLGVIMPILITNIGWRNGYLFLAGAFFILTVLLSLVLVKDSPGSSGLLAYGDVKKTINESNLEGIVEEGTEFSKAIKSKEFYMIYIGFIMLAILVSFYQHIPAFFTERGLSSVSGGALMSVYMLSMIAAKIIAGVFHDKLGSKATVILCYGLFLGAFIFLSNSNGYLLLVIGMILFSFGTGSISVLPPLMTNLVFGEKDYSKIYGIIGTAGAVGMTIGTPIWGYVYDTTESYNIGLYGGYILVPLVIVLLLQVVRTTKKTSN